MKCMITFTSSDSTVDLTRLMLPDQPANRFQAGQKMMKYWRALMGGQKAAKVEVGVNAVQATGTVTLSSFVANDTVTINGVVLTGKASPATEAEFLIGADDTATAVALAAAIGAHSTLGLILSATSALGVVTITALVPGAIGNAVTLAISAHGSVSAARMASGVNATNTATLYFGSGV